MKDVVLLGYGGHALVVFDVLKGAGYDIIGYYEMCYKELNPLGLRFLGSETEESKISKYKDCIFFPAIGDNYIRGRIIEFIANKELRQITAISYSSFVSESVKIKESSLICNGAVINSFAKLGKGVITNTQSVVEHESIIGDYVHIAPGAIVLGGVKIGAYTLIGANSVLREGVTIGNNCVIGAGSVVVNNIPDGQIWYGNPATRRNINK